MRGFPLDETKENFLRRKVGVVDHHLLPPDVVVALERGGSQLNLGVALQADGGALPVDEDVDNDDDGVESGAL